jgi:5'-3' exonuclease
VPSRWRVARQKKEEKQEEEQEREDTEEKQEKEEKAEPVDSNGAGPGTPEMQGGVEEEKRRE